MVALRAARARSTADAGRTHASLARGMLSLVGAVAASVFAGSALTETATAATTITITPITCAGGGTTFCFDPEAATAQTGSPVTWTDQSAIAHEIAPCTSSACPGSPPSTGSNTFAVLVPANGHGSFTFTNPGTYYYYCTIHGYAAMHGRITITTPAPPHTPGPTPRPTRAPTPRPTSTAPSPSPIAVSPPPATQRAILPTIATSPATTPSSRVARSPTGTASPGVRVALTSNTSPALPIAVAAVILVVVAGGASYLAYHYRSRRTP